MDNKAEIIYQQTARGFDQAAEYYDGEEMSNPVLERMRAEHWRWFEPAFPAPARLIELGSGTGREAARLAAEGRAIALLDVAPGMLNLAATRVQAARPAGLLGQHLLPASQVGELRAIYGPASFDGAYSSFGPLNCEPDLAGVAEGLAHLVRPGGRLVFSVMPRWCLTEIAWFGLHGEWSNAIRRLRGPVMARALPGQERLIKTFYYNPAEFTRPFQPYFRRVRIKALPLIWPPPYLSHLPHRWPGLFGQLGRVDDWLSGRVPNLAVFGDHFLIELERVQVTY
jgi:SAM-dependent methyltransferase